MSGFSGDLLMMATQIYNTDRVIHILLEFPYTED
jgi:hypothetical protein